MATAQTHTDDRSENGVVADRLTVDQSYRNNLDRLPTIKPLRFNPTDDTRLPILHA